MYAAVCGRISALYGFSVSPLKKSKERAEEIEEEERDEKKEREGEKGRERREGRIESEIEERGRREVLHQRPAIMRETLKFFLTPHLPLPPPLLLDL
jgi:hypothetical protein